MRFLHCLYLSWVVAIGSADVSVASAQAGETRRTAVRAAPQPGVFEQPVADAAAARMDSRIKSRISSRIQNRLTRENYASPNAGAQIKAATDQVRTPIRPD